MNSSFRNRSKSRQCKVLVAFVGLVALSSHANSSCWGQGERTEEIFRQEFRLKHIDGPVQAVVSYQIYARGEVCESGLIEAIDNRRCTANPYARKFFRTITMTPKDGASVVMGRTEKLVAAAPRIEKSGPCTDHAAALTNEFFASQIANANAWKSEIDGDLVAVKNTLKLIGEIESTTITLQK